MRLDVERVVTQIAQGLRSNTPRTSARCESDGVCGPVSVEWAGVVPPLAKKSEYRLDELLRFKDRRFVEQAYRTILLREPDESGLARALASLREGQLSKVELLAELRWSPEGVARGVHIDGLMIPFAVERWKRRRVLGPLIAWAHAIVRLPRLVRQLNVIEAQAAHETTALAAEVARAEKMQWTAAEARLHALSKSAETRLRHIDLQLQGIEAGQGRDRTELTSRLQHFADDLRGLMISIQSGLESEMGRISEHADRAHFRADAAAENLERVALEGRAAVEQLSSRLDRIDPPAVDGTDSLYVAFEDRFRGDSALIAERMRPYLEFIREANVGTASTPVLDLGSGGADWLALLDGEGLHARGVDSNARFVDLAHGRGLDVVESDALAYLASLPADSVGAVTAMHLIEHIPFNALLHLLDDALRVLVPGGLLVLETPNPENLLVGAHQFYTDPTHRNPIPPATLEWLVRARGFKRVTTRRLSEARETGAPSHVGPEVPGHETINAMVAHYAIAPDYAVTARKL